LRLAEAEQLAAHLRAEYDEDAEQTGAIAGILAWTVSVQQSYTQAREAGVVRTTLWEAWLRAHGGGAAQIRALRGEHDARPPH
jgi:hypothetical protein